MIPPWEHKHVSHQKNNPRTCTLEHLDDRLSGERGKHNGEYRRVAACEKCNTERGQASERAAGIDELRRRAQNGHRQKSAHP